MKKIIDGKSYNTETAEEICGYAYGNYGDFARVNESLYKSKKGTFFLAGSGGAQSKYAENTGPNEIGGGENIEVVTEKEARDFAETHGDPDVTEKFFAVEEG